MSEATSVKELIQGMMPPGAAAGTGCPAAAPNAYGSARGQPVAYRAAVLRGRCAMAGDIRGKQGCNRERP